MRLFRSTALLALLLVSVQPADAQQRLTSPRDFLGFDIGDDYHLATYRQLNDWWHVLAEESPRMIVRQIGTTEEGRPHVMAIITSPENHANLERYRDISRRLGKAEGLDDDGARALAREGKAVVWIDGGLHATEVLGAHQLMETVWQLVSMDDEETLRFLDDVVVLAVHANPDGHDLVADWYMREEDPEKRSTSGIPVLYQKYAGHDNNRDFYMSTQAETVSMNRVLYREWLPQIVYNHHQTGPYGTVMFAPPFRDPFNFNYHPLLPLGIEAVGAAMHGRMVAEGKGGTTMRSGAGYSTWWNGGLRTTPYFHNMIGLLTETIGHPTPMRIPLVLDRQLPRNDIPLPIEPQEWHFRQSIDYSVTANRAVLNYASRNREDLLYNFYVMGRDNIRKGQQDTWRTDPSVITAAERFARDLEAGISGQGSRWETPDTVFAAVFRDPERRDPRAYVLPGDQVDLPTAVRFVNTLLRNGIDVERATEAFEVGRRRYPAGSYVVFTAQAARPFVLDLFEPQVHPNDFAYPGGPPVAPYDQTGWTVAYKMGIEFDRILDGFEGPFERVGEEVAAPAGVVTRGSGGYLLDPRVNAAYAAANRLLADGEEVYRLQSPVTVPSGTLPAGAIYVRASGQTAGRLEALASDLGVHAAGVARADVDGGVRVRPPRIALWDRYGGSMPSGWTRWVLEQFGFGFEVVYAPQLDSLDLEARFDVIVFPTGAVPASDRVNGRGADPESIPAEYRDRVGSVSVEATVPRLLAFMRAGGTVIALGSSAASMAEHAGLGTRDWMVDQSGAPLRREDYYVPGSILRVAVDDDHPLAWGLDAEIDVDFDNSPVWDTASAPGVDRVAWFDRREPLRSGWAWGQPYLNGGATILDAPVGGGRLVLFGPEILFRGQPHGTFKMFFNALLRAGRP